MSPWGLPLRSTFVRCIGSCRGVEARNHLSSYAGEIKVTLREEFLDSVAQRCDVTPGSRFSQRVHMSACVVSDRAASPHRGRVRVHFQPGHPLLGLSSSGGVCGLLAFGYHSDPDTWG